MLKTYLVTFLKPDGSIGQMFVDCDSEQSARSHVSITRGVEVLHVSASY